MQDDTVEVAFCDLCGTSVPIADMAAGTAVRHQNKTVGACCLGALRPSGAAVIPPVDGLRTGAPSTAGEVRLMPVAIVLLAAVAGATIFLDYRLTSADSVMRQNYAQLAEAQAADGRALAGMVVTMDAVPRRAELDVVVAKLAELAIESTAARTSQQKEIEAVRLDVAAVGKEQRTQIAQFIDYRPLIEDLRQRQLRLVDLVTTLRVVSPVAAVPVVPEPGPATPAEASGPPGLPPALAEQVKKLQATDPAARFEAVDELLRSKDPAVLTHLLPLARDPDNFVRRLTVEGLGEFKRPEAVEGLLVALADADEYVRETAWRALKEVTGQKIPFETGASKDARARAVQKWQDWWDKNKATFGA